MNKCMENMHANKKNQASMPVQLRVCDCMMEAGSLAFDKAAVAFCMFSGNSCVLLPVRLGDGTGPCGSRALISKDFR